MASRNTSPSPSQRDAMQNTSLAAIKAGTSRRMPGEHGGVRARGPEEPQAAGLGLGALAAVAEGVVPHQQQPETWVLLAGDREGAQEHLVGLLWRKARDADEHHVTSVDRERSPDRVTVGLVRRPLEGLGVQAVVHARLSCERHPPVGLDETAHVIREHHGARRDAAEPAMDPADQGPAQDLLIVVLAAHQLAPGAEQEGCQGRERVRLQEVGVDDVAPPQIRPQPQRKQRPRRRALHPLGAGLEEVLAQGALPLEEAHPHRVSSLHLPAHLLEHVHLGTTHVERGQDVNNLHPLPAASSAS